MHNAFDDLDARYKEDEGDHAPSITLSDNNEGYIVLGYCRQHPARVAHASDAGI